MERNDNPVTTNVRISIPITTTAQCVDLVVHTVRSGGPVARIVLDGGLALALYRLGVLQRLQ